MSYFKTTAIVFLIFGALFPSIVYAGDSSHKIIAECNPKCIRVNHPFELTFSYNSPDIHNAVSSEVTIRIPYDFKVINGPNTITSIGHVTKEKIEQATSLTYRLVAKRTGDILFTPWSLTLSNKEVYTSDSVWIHIYDEFTSVEDSIEKLTASSLNRKDIDTLHRNTGRSAKSNPQWDALEHLDSMIQLNTNDTMAYFERGKLYYEMNAFKHAIKDFETVIKLNPKFADAYINHGAAKLHINDYSGVLFDFNKAIELDSGISVAFENRGSVKKDFKDYTGALKDFNKAIQLSPKDTLLYLKRADLYVLMENYDSAMSDLNLVVTFDPAIPTAFSIRGWVKYKQHDCNAAIDDYNKALELDPERAKCYGNRGLCKLELGDKEGACIDLALALKFGFEQAEDTYKMNCK